jgi:predicted permease
MNWVKQMVFRHRLYSQLSAEIREHLEEKIEELIARGMSREKAAAAARREFGNVTLVEEDSRGVWRWPSIESLFTDIRFGARLLRRSLTFTAVAVLTLALGIGANTAVFSIVDAVLLRPLPYKGADRLVAVWSTEIGQPGTKIFAPYRDFEEFRAHNQSFEELAALTWARAGEILTWRGSPHEVLAIPASADFFSLLGMPAAQGRTFRPEDVQSGCTVVLAHSFWRTELAATSDVVGSTLTLNGRPCAVAGVMPNGFEFYPKQTSLWTLITPESGFSQKPLNSVVGIFGRLKAGVSMASAERELTALHQRVVNESPAGSWVAQTVPIVRDLREQFTWMAGRNLRTALLVLSAAVGLVLLIACLNVANLLIGRSVERQRELAVRAALGSGRSRLIRQLLVESMLLAGVGTVAGILLALTGVRYFNSANLVELPPGNPIAVNLHVLGFTTLLAAVTGLFFGLVPAWRASQVDLNEILKQSGRSVAQGKGHRTSKWLVVGQVMLSMILLAGAGLLIESIVRLGSVPLGFRSDHLVTATVALPPAAYSEATQRVTFYGRLIGNLAALPGVEGVALCSSLPPYNGGGSSELAVAGKAAIENLEAVNSANISAAYFRVLGLPLLRGREFDSRDRERSQRVAIVNEEMARRYFPKEDPIGRKIKLGRADDGVPWLTIAGVVGNEKRTVVYQEMGYVEPALVYLPVEQAATTSMGLLMRVAGNPLLLSPMLQSAISHLDSGVPVYDVRTMTDRYSEFLAHPRFRAILMGILAALTLLLAAIGIYGVLAQLVSQRTQEIGVRLALGARPADVFGLVLREGMKMTVVGVVIGLLAASGLTRLMSTMLYGVRATDPLVFIGVATVLTLVALSACYVPARRTTRVDPMVALRYE